jgi:hypothetical protein
VKPGVLPTFPDLNKLKKKVEKSNKEVAALKYDKTPLSEDDLIQKDREGRWFAQLLMKPIPSYNFLPQINFSFFFR